MGDRPGCLSGFLKLILLGWLFDSGCRTILDSVGGRRAPGAAVVRSYFFFLYFLPALS